jgi:cardiolipin synthase
VARPAWPTTSVAHVVEQSTVRFLRDGRQAFPAMLDAIENARQEVLLEMYWVEDDVVGLAFRDALARAAARGVRVRVLYDSFGSYHVNPTWWGPLSLAGGKIWEFHPISPLDERFQLARVETRDHRKMLVVDSAQAYVGGLNLARAWLPREAGGDNWRDDMLAVHGSVGLDLRALFYRQWARLTKESLPADLAHTRLRAAAGVWVLASPWRSSRSIRGEFLRRLKRASQSIDIANSYFLPDARLRRALYRAVRRGVRVRVLVPATCDVLVVQRATEALISRLLKRGIEIYRLNNAVLHSKTAIIDDFVTIGSYNMDARSLRKNLEVNLAVENRTVANEVRASFEHDLQNSHKVNPRAWNARPLSQRSIEWACYALRRFL